jgi:hypothetical protein
VGSGRVYRNGSPGVPEFRVLQRPAESAIKLNETGTGDLAFEAETTMVRIGPAMR